MKCTVFAHHNVEDFRPYSFNFKDKGEKNANVAHALKLAIKRESKWRGWFDSYGLLEGISLKDINKKIDEMFANNEEYLIILGSDRNEGEEVVPSEHSALVVWSKQEDNVGFGEAWSEDSFPTICDTDKYTNRWLEIV